MQKYALSTIMWVESIAKKEIEKQWGKIEEVVDRLVVFSWPPELIPRINYWSRVWNKMYMLLTESENIDNFDKLYNLINWIYWKKFFKKSFPILIKATSIRSDLISIPSIQKIWKKAIINSLTNKSWEVIKEDGNLEKMDILVLIIDNKVRILLNTSWSALHMRWYRTEAWEAPIKESLAAAIVLLSNWRFKENFYDPFCWSWTIAIEALMIAKNIAPWLKRRFAFENLWLVNYEMSENERTLARNKTFEWEYKIFASDIDLEMIKISKQNAKNAWLKENEITFEVKDFKTSVPNPLSFGVEWEQNSIKWTLVSNPPYWLRLKDEDLKGIYCNIDKLFRINTELKWWIITSFLEFDNLIKLDNYKKRKLYNWWELCYFYRKR